MLPTPLSSSQRAELLRAKNASGIHPKVRERIEMVLLADAGWESRQIENVNLQWPHFGHLNWPHPDDNYSLA